MITVFYSSFPGHIPDDIWQSYLQLLPLETQQKLLRYHFWKDRYAGLYGQHLLLQAFLECGLSKQDFFKIKRTYYGRPYLNDDIDFNISHSGNHVVCAISHHNSLGIDIEAIRSIEYQDFNSFMSNEEWINIQNSPDSLRTFFEYWTKKESIIKADGRGLSAPLANLTWINKTTALLDKKQWFLNPLPIADGYSCYAASDSPEQNIKIIRKTITE